MPVEQRDNPEYDSPWPGRVALFSVLWVALVVTLLWVLPSVKPRCIWSSTVDSVAQPRPAEFLYVMFPLSDDVPLWDSPGGKRVGTLKRAVACEQAELTGGGWVHVNDVQTTSWVRLTDLRFLPPHGNEAVLFEALLAVFRARDPKESRSGSFTLATVAEPPAGSKHTVATIRLQREDNWEEYQYTVTADTTEPLAIYRQYGPAASFRRTLRWVIAFSIATPLACVPMLIGLVRNRMGAKAPRSGSE